MYLDLNRRRAFIYAQTIKLIKFKTSLTFYYILN